MGGDQVDVLGQHRVFFPHVPLFGRGDRDLDRGAYTIEKHAQLFGGDFLAEDRFVTHDHANHTARVVGDLDGSLDFTFVAFLVRADPDSEGHAQAELFRQLGNIAQGAVDRIDPDVVGQFAHDLQVTTHFLIGRELVFLWELALLERRVRKTGDLLWPVGGCDRAVDQRPETGEQRGNRQHYHQVESKFTR
ncbi:hypothetical protein D3C84_848540 [compost metagenome]